MPGKLELSLVRSKKLKQIDVLPQEQSFVCPSGPSAERAALDFVQKDWAFVDLDEQLRAMQGFVAAFRGSPEGAEFRGILERKITADLGAFEDGGPFQNLITLRKFSELGKRAYANDAPLQKLHERVVGRIEFVETRLKLLRSLALVSEWDVFLDRYQEFERYQWSFPDIIALRQDALEESARTHSRRARAYAQREDHEIAVREAQTAQLRDPKNKETFNLLESEKILASQLEAKRAAAT